MCRSLGKPANCRKLRKNGDDYVRLDWKFQETFDFHSGAAGVSSRCGALGGVSAAEIHYSTARSRGSRATCYTAAGQHSTGNARSETDRSIVPWQHYADYRSLYLRACDRLLEAALR